MTDPSQLDVAAMLTEVGVDASSASPVDSVGNTTILRSAESEASLPVYDSGGTGAVSVTFGQLVREDKFSAFFSARQNSMLRKVLVRTVHPKRQTQQAAERILSEGWMLGALEHPNILPVYGVGKDRSDRPIVLTKHVDTVSWTEILAQPRHALGPRNGDPLDFNIRRVLAVTRAVEHAHQRTIVHRDIKPDNVLVDDDGTVYLHGWHLAVSLVNDGTGRFPLSSEQQQIAGTPAYMAPELATKNHAVVGVRTDVYLLGATLHHALTGRPRHLGENVFDAFFSAVSSTPFEYGDDIPTELAEILNKAMAADPADRFESASHLRFALEEFLRHRPATTLTQHAEQAHAEFDRAVEKRSRDYIVRELFATAYTAYNEALQFHARYPAARAGLERVLGSMIRYEANKGSTRRARDLLSRLESPPAELVAVVERAAAKADLSMNIDASQAIEVDPSAADARKIFMYICVVIWTSFGLMFGFVDTFGLMDVTRLSLQIAGALCWISIAGVAALLGPSLLRNLTDRYVLGPFTVVLVGSAILQMQSMVTGGTPEELVVNHFLLFFIIMATVNAFFDWRLIPSSLAYAGAYIVGLFLPELAYWAMAASNLVGLGFAGVVIHLRLTEGDA